MTQLRIGLILPDETIPAWAARLLEDTRAQPQVEGMTVLFIPQKKNTGGLYRAYVKLDRRAFHPNSNPLAMKPLPADLPLLRGGLDELRSLHLDILINLCLADVPAELPSLARLGVWTLRDGRSRLVIGAPLGWRELSQNELLTTCQVEVTRADGSAQIVAQALLATDPLSVSRNQLRLLWRAAALMPRAIRQMIQRGEADFFATAQPAVQTQHAAFPNLFQLALLAPKQLFRKLSKKFRKRFLFDQWMLMIAPRANSAPLTWDGFRPLVPPPDRLWADPFIVEREGQTYIFIEELLFAKKRGVISVLTLDTEGRLVTDTPVLERPYHLSYPFVFEHRGVWYMIPESSADRSVDVYRCTRFPDQWTFEKTLLRDVPAWDTTLLEHAGRWWMFVNLVSDAGNSTWDSLHLFYADNPLSENWTAHPLNPVVSDVRSARPAGRLFLRDGKLFRPSQDSSQRYGFGLRLNRVDKLSSSDYAETCVETLTPPRDRNIIATHTLNSTDKWTVIDIQSRRSKFSDRFKL